QFTMTWMTENLHRHVATHFGNDTLRLVRESDLILIHYIPEHTKYNSVQVQWYILQPGGYKTSILVFNTVLGLNIHESPLKGRVNISEQSLIIRNVEMSDAGLYSCSVTTFPSGSLEKSTNLIVRGEYVIHSSMLPLNEYMKCVFLHRRTWLNVGPSGVEPCSVLMSHPCLQVLQSKGSHTVCKKVTKCGLQSCCNSVYSTITE
uniref:Ig-like domain-containing protein n=1 Tax=Monopterus albus TaxID=43700 RepID=A0A3Q3RE29_MONAL